MAEPTLTQIFGTGATQDSTTLTIQKSALASTGLTASANNNAESLLVAIVIKAQEYLTQSNFEANIDQSITVEPGFSSFTARGIDNTSYRVDQLSVNLAKLDDNATINPDDY
jgi:hypothetical protein